jgi:hypothetical protein
MPATKWLSILNWKQLPAFGEIHRLDEQHFMDLYFSEHSKIQHMAACLFSGLKGEFPPNNCRIIGFPGMGKTTFLYYLKARVKRTKQQSGDVRCFFKIVDCDSVLKNDETVDRDLLSEVLYSATKDYFQYFDSVWANEKIKNLISNGSLTPAEKTKHLWGFFKDNLSLFPHRLFLALDGIDTVPEQSMIPLAVAFHNALPHRYVRLWLSIRDIKYESLGEVTRRQLDTLFQEPHKFPSIELGGVIRTRIGVVETSEGVGKNPFSDQLCNFLTNFYNGDMRRSLAMLNRILQEVSPKGLEDKQTTSEKFIQPYMEREALRVMFQSGEIPNLYDVAFSAFRSFPFEKEVLMAVSAHPRLDALLSEVLVSEIRSKLEAFNFGHELRRMQKWNITDGALAGAIKFLAERGLIEMTGASSLVLTSKGWELQKMCETEYYTTLCRAELEAKLKNAAPGNRYWELASVATPYQEVVLEKMLAGGAF